jgi:hypothetical protein
MVDVRLAQILDRFPRIFLQNLPRNLPRNFRQTSDLWLLLKILPGSGIPRLLTHAVNDPPPIWEPGVTRTAVIGILTALARFNHIAAKHCHT